MARVEGSRRDLPIRAVRTEGELPMDSLLPREALKIGSP